MDADDWMCERLNEILNNLDNIIAPEILKALGEMSEVIRLANRRKDKEGNYDREHIYTDRDRNSFDYKSRTF